MLGSKSSSLPSIMSSSEHQSMIPKDAIPRSKFDRSHGYKTTFNSGLLIPFYWDEVLPGDIHNVSVTTSLVSPLPLFQSWTIFGPRRSSSSFPIVFWENWENSVELRIILATLLRSQFLKSTLLRRLATPKLRSTITSVFLPAN